MWTNTTAIGAIPPERCHAALQISRQPHLLLLMSVIVCMCLFGFTSSCLLAYYLYRKPVYHINIRLLMWSMCVALALMSGGLCYLTVDHLVTFALYQDDPCRMVVGYLECHTRHSITLVMPAFVVANSVVALAVERGYATYAYRTYDMRPSRAIGIGLIIAQWTIGSVPTVVIYIMMKQEGLEGNMPYCLSLLVAPITMTIGMLSAVACDVATLSSIVVLLFINAGKLRRQVDVQSATVNNGHLSRRYQLKENLKTTRMLIPCLIVHLLVNTASVSTATFVAMTGRLESDADVSRLAVFNEIGVFLLTCYPMAFCITCVVQSPSLLKHVRSEWSCLETPTEDAALPDAAVDHKMMAVQLDNVWKSTKLAQRRVTEVTL